MKKHIIIFIFLAVVIFLLGMRFGYRMLFASVEDPVQITDENANAEHIDLEEIHRRHIARKDSFVEGIFTRTYLQDSYSKESIRITYPQLEDVPENQKVNELIKEDALSILKTYSVDDLEELTLEVDYKISLKTDSVLSIIYFASYAIGEADEWHRYNGAQYRYTTNIDLTTGEKLYLNTVVSDVAELCDEINSRNLVYRSGSRIYTLDTKVEKLEKCDYKNHSNEIEEYSYFTEKCLGISFSFSGLQVEIPYEDVELLKSELFIKEGN